MARLQILELPAGSGDDRPPFILVIDEAAPGPNGGLLIEARDFLAAREDIGACDVFIFEETIDIPANDPVPLAVLSTEGDSDDADHAELLDIVHRVLGITPGEGPADVAGWLLTACRELEKSEAARGHLRRERDALKTRLRDALPATENVDPERAGVTQIVYAHEQTRLDLCNALLLSGDTTWRKLIERVTERQRELAETYRKLDAVKEARLRHKIALLGAFGMDHTRDWDDIVNTAPGLRKGRDVRAAALERLRNLPTHPKMMDAQHEQPQGYLHGYKVAIGDAQRAARTPMTEDEY